MIRLKELLKKYGAKILLGFVTSFFVTVVCANPVLNNIGSGNVYVRQTPGTTTIYQNSNRAILNWNSFNINKGEATHFVQPYGGVALNRISPLQGASQIYGMLTATGKIILVNPAGIYFGPSAYVNVGGLIATTAGISDTDFLNGNYSFTHAGAGSIVNEGTIIAANHGLVALVGSNVTNNGLIQANLGRVVLASGDAFTMSFAGNDLINFAITKPSGKPKITNTGAIIADGGHIMVSAAAARGTLDNVINLNGVVQARSVQQVNGEIIISGDPNGGQVKVAANINASGRNKNQTGGNVKISGYDIALESPTTIDASGDIGGGSIIIGNSPLAHNTNIASGVSLTAEALSSGRGGFIETSGQNLNLGDVKISTKSAAGLTGTWLLDPTNIYIANNQANATAAGMLGTDSSANAGTTTFEASGAVQDSLLLVSTLQTGLASNNILVTTTNASGTGLGDINVVDPITWNSTNTLTLQADNNILINNALNGSNGGLILNAVGNITTNNLGSINVANFNLAQGNFTQVGTLPAFNASNDFQISSGATFIRASAGNGTALNPYAIADIFGLQGIGSTATTLGNSYILAGNINAAGTATWNAGAGFNPIGDAGTPFTGSLNGAGFAISNLFINSSLADVGLFGVVQSAATPAVTNLTLTSPTITGNASGNVGSLVGRVNSSQISNVTVTGSTVTGTANGSEIGGIIGFLNGASTLTNLSATGTITGVGSSDVGGVVALTNGGTINTASFSGDVSQTGTGSVAGGVVAQLANGATLSNAISSGTVSGTNLFGGGLVGWNLFSDISNSSSSSAVTGTTNSIVGGLVGLNDTTSSITGSRATGSVTGINNVGGLVGQNFDVITTSYASGAVNGNDTVGGLVGSNENGASISGSASAATVTASTNVGGIAGYNDGSISTSYNTGAVTATSTVSGGIVGFNDTNGTISDVFNFGITRAAATTAGIAALNNGLVTRALNAGNVDPNALNAYSLVAINNGTLSNGFYDTSMAAYVGSPSTGTITNVQPGSLVNPSIGEVNLSQQATYQAAGWNFASTWSILEGNSYPYLQGFYSAAPQVFSGISGGALNGTTYQLAVNGSNYAQTFGGTNGNFYFLLGNNTISGIDNTIAPNSVLLFYTPGDAQGGAQVAISKSDGTGFSGDTRLTQDASTLRVGVTGSNYVDPNTYSITTLNTAIGNGSLVDVGIPYSISGNNLTLAANTTFSADTTYNVTGNITASGTGSIIANELALSTDSILTAANISLFRVLGNNHALTVSASTAATLGANGPSGILNDLSALTLTGGGTYDLNSSSSSYTGATNVNSGTLNINTATALSNSSQVNVASGATLNINAVNLSTNNPIVLNGGTLTGTGTASTGSSAITLNNANTTFTSLTSGSTFSIDGTINGASNLILAGPGNFQLSGLVGAVTPLTSLTANTNIAFGGGVRTSGSQTYNNALTLIAPTAFTATAGNLNFANTINGAFALTTSSSGTSTFGGIIGGTTPLTGLDVTASGININTNAITTSGSQRYHSPVTLNTSPTLSSGSGTIIFDNSVNGSGQVLTLQNNTAGSTGAVTFNGDVTLSNLITFGAPANYAVALLGSNNTFSNLVTFNNTGGLTLGDSSTDNFNFNGGVTASGNATFGGVINTNNNALNLANLTLNAATSIDTGTATFNVGTISGAQSLDVNALTKTFNGSINVSSLTLTGGSTILNTPAITTAGAQSFDALTLTSNTALNASTLNFNNTINGAFALSATSTGATTFANTVGGTTPLTSLSVTAPGGININTTGITTNGAQTYNNNVTLGASPTLKSGSGTITFNGAVNGAAQTLTLQDASSTGSVIFNGDVNVASLVTFAGPYSIALNGSSYTFANPVSFNNTGNLALGNSASDLFNFDTGFTRTVGATTLSGIFNTTNSDFTLGTVVLGSNTSITTGTGAISLGAISGAFALSASSSLTKTLNGAVNVASLSLGGGGANVLNTGSVITSGAQNYTDALNLTTTTNLSGSSLTFGNNINGAVALTTTGATTFTGAVGNATPLASLTVNGSSVALNNVTTTGTQTYNAPVTLNGNALLTGSSIAFNGIANGNNNSLGVTTTVLNIQGTLNALNSMNVSGSGSNNLFTLNTGGTQTWNYTGVDSGNIVVAGVASPISFTNIQNTIGGSGADNFSLAPGSSQSSFNGGAGINSLTSNFSSTDWIINGVNAGTANGIPFANIQNVIGGAANTFTISSGFLSSVTGSGSDIIIGSNAPTTWNISGANSGSMSNIGSFAGISDITGGNGGNTFNFGNGATLSGVLFGGNDTTNVLNTINFSGYTTPVTVNLSANKFIGTAVGIVNYQNINSLVANSANGNILNVTPTQLADTTLSSKYVGIIGDPLFFNGFIVPGLIFGGTPVPGGGTLIPFDVSQIIQQGDLFTDNNLIIYNNDVENNIREIVLDIDNRVTDDMTHVRINPYCTATSGLGI